MFAIGFCFTALMGMFNSMWVAGIFSSVISSRAFQSVKHLAIVQNVVYRNLFEVDSYLNMTYLLTGSFYSALMEEWWPSYLSSHCRTSRDCRTAICWAKITPTALLSSCTSYAQCLSDRYFLFNLRFVALMHFWCSRVPVTHAQKENQFSVKS